ncbi:DUF1877 family protein [Streptomyces chiangmaiensis]|uniref:DUF1877 family protein n=1 Tax=Streptomyces chiangmaiensis TaxID=766497 RepID=A0ABU7FPF7_9ACTN|nr:DUF1877 family protein [Streptomyces chiangmaiensis]MED7825944.1 DUF1877 family protein [Streptomyces chiangmaiensis]
MSTYLHLRAVPPPALRNSATWLQRLFEDDRDGVRGRVGRHREKVLDKGYLEQELLYAGARLHRAEDPPRTQVVLGGQPVFPPDRNKPPFLLLTAAQANRVAAFLASAGFETLWRPARGQLLPRHGGRAAEPETRGAFAAAHRDLTAFYVRTAECGDAVVKWFMD